MSGHWNYRLVQGNDMLWLLEVYYDDDDVIWGWSDEHVIIGENTVAIEDGLRMLGEALTKPILDYTELPRGENLLPITGDELVRRARVVAAKREAIASAVEEALKDDG